MALNLKSFQYRPIYQGIGLEAIGQDLEKRGQAFDTNLENYNKVMEYAATIRALPGDQEYLKNSFKAASDQISHIADQTHGTGRWDLGKSAVNSVRAKFLQDPTITAIRESYANFQKEEETKAQLRAQGQTPLTFSDFASHKSVNPNGSINIYRGEVEAKGNYLAEAASIWKAIEPEIQQAGLTKSDISGILQGKIVKGITRERIMSALDNVSNAYKTTGSYMQQHKLKSYQGSENPDKEINDFLLGVGMLRENESTTFAYQGDPEWEAQMKAQQSILQGQIALQKKKASGRGNADFDNPSELYFGINRVVKATYNVGEGNRLGKLHTMSITNPELSKGISNTRNIPMATQFKFVGEGDNVKALNKDKEKIQFVGDSPLKITGIIPTDIAGGDYLGGFYATAKVKVGDSGKEQTANILIKNDIPAFKDKVRTLNAIEQNFDKDPNKTYRVEDSSGLLSFANAELYKMASTAGNAGLNGKVKFRVKPNGKGGGTIIPVLHGSGDVSTPLDPKSIEFLGLKPEYTIEDIYKMTGDILVNDIQPFLQTKTSSQQ